MKKQSDVKTIYIPKIKINYRIVWYSVILWVLGFLIAAVVMIPWYYLVLAIMVCGATFYYFRILELKVKRGPKARSERDKIFAFGLGAAVAWFGIIALLTLAEIAGFYYFDFLFYFSDFRNWYLLTLVLVVPVVYGLVLENSKSSKRKKSKQLFAKI